MSSSNHRTITHIMAASFWSQGCQPPLGDGLSGAKVRSATTGSRQPASKSKLAFISQARCMQVRRGGNTATAVQVTSPMQTLLTAAAAGDFCSLNGVSSSCSLLTCGQLAAAAGALQLQCSDNLQLAIADPNVMCESVGHVRRWGLFSSR